MSTVVCAELHCLEARLRGAIPSRAIKPYDGSQIFQILLFLKSLADIYLPVQAKLVAGRRAGCNLIPLLLHPLLRLIPLYFLIMLYQIAFLAVLGTAFCLPPSFNVPSVSRYTKRDEVADLYPRCDSETFPILVERELWADIEARSFDDEDFLLELHTRVNPKPPKPPVPPKPANLKSAPKTSNAQQKAASPPKATNAPQKAASPSKTNAAPKTNPAPAAGAAGKLSGKSSGGTGWTKKVQQDAKKENKQHWYNKLGIGNKNKGKKDPNNPVPNLEKVAAKQAHKITGYSRKESDDTDKKNKKAGIKNRKEEDINKMKAAKLTNYNSDMRYVNTGKDVITTAGSVVAATHTLGLLKRRELLMRDPEAWAQYLGFDLEELY